MTFFLRPRGIMNVTQVCSSLPKLFCGSTYIELSEVKWSCSVVSNSLGPRGLQLTRFLCPWDFPGKSTGVGCHFLLQGILPTQGSNPGLPRCSQTLLPSEPPGKFWEATREYIELGTHQISIDLFNWQRIFSRICLTSHSLIQLQFLLILSQILDRVLFVAPCLGLLGFPGSSDRKVSAFNAGDRGSIPGREEPPEKEMATHSSILVWKIPWTEDPGRLQSIGL